MKLKTSILPLLALLVASEARAYGPGPVPGITTAVSPLHRSGVGVYIDTANASQPGALSASDWRIAMSGGGGGGSYPLTEQRTSWVPTSGAISVLTSGGSLITAGGVGGSPVWGSTFTQANVTLGGTLPEFPYVAGFSGGVWLNDAGASWAVTSNAAHWVGGGGGTIYADAGYADGTVSVTISHLAAADAPFLLFRSNAAETQFWAWQAPLAPVGGTDWTFVHCTGVYSGCVTVATGTGPVNASGDVLSVTLFGSSIIGKVNGATILTVSNGTFSTNTGYGIGDFSNASTLFTNLAFSALVDDRSISLKGHSVPGDYSITLGASGRGPHLAGVKIGGPAGSGQVEVSPSAVLDSSLTVAGLQSFTGAAPTSPTAGSGCGTSSAPTVAAGSTDNDGNLSVTCGTAASAALPYITVTFAKPRAVSPFCTATPTNTTTVESPFGIQWVSATTTTMSINCGCALASATCVVSCGSGTLSWNYHCFGPL